MQKYIENQSIHFTYTLNHRSITYIILKQVKYNKVFFSRIITNSYYLSIPLSLDLQDLIHIYERIIVK